MCWWGTGAVLESPVLALSHTERLHEKPWNDFLQEHVLSHAFGRQPDLLQTLAKGILLAGDTRVRLLLWVEEADEWSVVL